MRQTRTQPPLRRLMANGEEGEIKGRAAEIYAEAAAFLLDGSTDRTLLIGLSSGCRATGCRRRYGGSSSSAARSAEGRDAARSAWR